eukprot:5442890-Amphidinium_carterae.1
MVKILNEVNRGEVLRYVNVCYETGQLPVSLTDATTILLLKPGKNPKDHSSYRPISLLNTLYKVCAKLVLNRLTHALDDYLSNLQFGFRRGKSTANAIFILRRVQDIYERMGQSVYFLALDYTKAFDSLPQDVLDETLKQYKVPDKLHEFIRAFYRHPMFQ